MKRWLAAVACSLAAHGAAPVLTQQQVEAAGRVGDAAVLKQVIESGSADLVYWFGRGLQLSQMDLPEDVEALVIANFNDARVGERLRAIPARYRTRRLFDLHYARAAAAFRLNEPSIEQILNTDLEGIEEDLLRLSEKFPKSERGLGGYVYYVARRRHPAAIPLLIAALGDSFQAPGESYNEVFESLLLYPSLEVWKKTSAELEAQRARIPPERYRAARAKLDARLANAPAALEEARLRAASETYVRRVRQLPFNNGRIEALKASDPGAYVKAQESAAASKEAIARELDSPLMIRNVGHELFELGMFARFRARNPAAAIRVFGKAADLGIELATVAIADTHRFDLQDGAAAIKAYRAALAEARNPRRTDAWSLYEAKNTRVNAWWRAWLQHEIAFLQTGRVFDATIGEAEIGGFFQVMLNKAVYVTNVFAPEFRIPNTRGITDGRGRPVGGTWSAARDQVMNIGRPTLTQRLEALPASHLALMMAIRHASALPDADAILAYFARNDPGGYWATCVFGTVAYLESLGERRREEAVRNESAELLPGLTVDEDPRPLSVAAQRFMASRGLRAR